MARFTLTEYIAAPPEAVFALASDFARASEVIDGIERVELLTDGPVGVGTRFRETRVMFKREATEEMSVTEFERPTHYALGCESCGCRYDTTMHFRPRAGGTDVEMVFEARPLTWVARIMGVLCRPLLGMCLKQTARDLADLKRALEPHPA